MRHDPSKKDDFLKSEQWSRFNYDGEVFLPVDANDPTKGYTSNSFSGNERNRFFIQSNGNFKDASLLSGADFLEDGRGFVHFDFDGDGWLDMGVTSPREPRFRILRNTMGDQRNEFGGTKMNSVYIGLEGGHQETEPTSEWSSRDAVGATFTVKTGDTIRKLQLSSGEGLSSQNSRWIHVGLGAAKTIDRVEVFWPSGKTTIHENIASGTRTVLYENEGVDKR